jgi:hypothetical protein
MDRLVKAVPGIAASLMLANSVAAPAQTQAAYDGTYVGVSATLLNPGTRETRSCGPLNAPPTLTIMGGVVHIDWGTGPFNGPISPHGAIALQNDYKSRLNAQIDAQGNVKGTIGAQCTYDSVWRKR